VDAFAPKLGAESTVVLTVSAADTALALRSGGLPVLGTPRLCALLEEAAVAAVAPFLPDGWQTVGTRLELRHIAATPVGATVKATARVILHDRRRVEFAVCATDEAGPIGEGTHERFLVEVEPFMARAVARHKR